MRWRFADRIDEFQAWVFIQGRKGVSLEEYSLLERFGRPGVFPEILTLETCIHFSRWLVERSSEFTQSCLIAQVENFTFSTPAGMGDNLKISVYLTDHQEDQMGVQCRVESDGRDIALGGLRLNRVPFGTLQDSETRRILWQELYGTP